MHTATIKVIEKIINLSSNSPSPAKCDCVACGCKHDNIYCCTSCWQIVTAELMALNLATLSLIDIIKTFNITSSSDLDSESKINKYKMLLRLEK